MATLKELQDEWDVWMRPTYTNRNGQEKKTIQETWRDANPGEYQALLDYRAGKTPKPDLASAMGDQMVEHVEAWLTEQAEMPSPPPTNTGPGILLHSPVNGQEITEPSVAFFADAIDPDGVSKVELYVNDVLKRTETDAPYGWGGPDGVAPFDLSEYENGDLQFKVVAYDASPAQLSTSMTVTAHLNVAATPPTPPPPSTETPLFDGRATRMDSISGSTYKNTDPQWTGGTDCKQSPIVWGGEGNTKQNEGIYCMTDSVKLVSDSKYGKVYEFEIGPGDTNPYFVQPTKPNGEVTYQRSLAQGQVDWYSDAVKMMSPYTLASFNVMDQLGYPSLASPPLSVCADSKGLGIDRHVGILIAKSDLSGPGTFIEKPRFWPVADILDKWVEFVIGVKWNVDSTGWIEVWARIPGETGFTKKFSRTNTPTWQQVQGQSIKSSGNDKMGLYFGTYTSPPTNKVRHRGVMRFKTKDGAIASMG